MTRSKTVSKPLDSQNQSMSSSGTVVSYLRVSTADQHLEPQRLALAPWSPGREFTDVMSGVKASRPGLDALMDWVRDGDTVIVYSLSRLGRSTSDLLGLLDRFESKGVRVVSATESIDTSTPSGRLVVTVLAAVAQMEREQLAERTSAGLRAAREQGRVGGRPRALTAEQARAVRMRVSHGESITAIARELGVSRSTAYRSMSAPSDMT